MPVQDQVEGAPEKTLRDHAFTEISSQQEGMATHTPAADILSEHPVVTVDGDSYFFDDSFNLLSYCPSFCMSDKQGLNPCFDLVSFDQHVNYPAAHGKEDISPAETILPDQLDSCQCQASVKM
jgi:hypothetical protein